MKTIGIISVVLVVLVLAWLAYYFIFNKSLGKSLEGTPCSSTGGTVNDGKIKNGVCVKNTIRSGPSPTNAPAVPVRTGFKTGDNVFLNPLAGDSITQDGIPVYRAPIADSPGTYLLGTVRPAWYVPNPIGKFVSDTGNGWSKVSVNDMQIFAFISGQYTFTVQKITQDVFFLNPAIQNKPY